MSQPPLPLATKLKAKLDLQGKEIQEPEAVQQPPPSRPPRAFVYLEEDVVIISTALKNEELVHLADALPDSDSATNLDWGIGEALRTLEEALELARSPTWQNWSVESRAFRWQCAGHIELGL